MKLSPANRIFSFRSYRQMWSSQCPGVGNVSRSPHTPVDDAIWLLQPRARANHELADPGQARGDRQAFCCRIADVERGPGPFRQPVEIAGMFFVVMRGDYRLDSVRRQTLEMAQESAAEPARSRVNRYAVIHDHQKVFAKEQRYQIAWQAIEHEKLKPAV